MGKARTHRRSGQKPAPKARNRAALLDVVCRLESECERHAICGIFPGPGRGTLRRNPTGGSLLCGNLPRPGAGAGFAARPVGAGHRVAADLRRGSVPGRLLGGGDRGPARTRPSRGGDRYRHRVGRLRRRLRRPAPPGPRSGTLVRPPPARPGRRRPPPAPTPAPPAPGHPDQRPAADRGPCPARADRRVHGGSGDPADLRGGSGDARRGEARARGDDHELPQGPVVGIRHHHLGRLRRPHPHDGNRTHRRRPPHDRRDRRDRHRHGDARILDRQPGRRGDRRRGSGHPPAGRRAATPGHRPDRPDRRPAGERGPASARLGRPWRPDGPWRFGRPGRLGKP